MDVKTIQFDVKHFAMAHLMWIVIIAVALVAGRSWLAEHDNRILAQEQEKISQQHSAELEAEFKAAAATIAQLQADKKASDDAHNAKIAGLQKQYAAITDRLSALQAINSAVQNAHAVASTTDSNSVVLDPIPVAQELTQCRIDRANLDKCTTDYQKDEQIVALQGSQLKAKDGQIADRDTTIKALKKPQGLWRRVVGTLKAVGIGVGIGVALGARL